MPRSKALCFIEGEIGIAEKRVGIVSGKRNDPDTGAQPQDMPANLEGLGQRVDDPRCNVFSAIAVGVANDHTKLVTAEAIYTTRCEGGRLDTLRRHAQEGITGEMAVAIIHEFEPVKINQEQCATGARREGFANILLEQGPVADTGERVEMREPVELILGLLALCGVLDDCTECLRAVFFPTRDADLRRKP